MASEREVREASQSPRRVSGMRFGTRGGRDVRHAVTRRWIGGRNCLFQLEHVAAQSRRSKSGRTDARMRQARFHLVRRLLQEFTVCHRTWLSSEPARSPRVAFVAANRTAVAHHVRAALAGPLCPPTRTDTPTFCNNTSMLDQLVELLRAVIASVNSSRARSEPNVTFS